MLLSQLNINEQLRKEWTWSLLGWSAVILFLTSIDKIYDWYVPEHLELDNQPWWAIQEWGLWYLLTPALFRLLSQANESNTLTSKRYALVCTLVFGNAMAYQGIFDLFVFRDTIAYSLLYFAPLYPLVIFINVFLWQRFIKPNRTADQDAVSHPNARLDIERPEGNVTLPFETIVNINSASNYVEVCTEEKTWLKRATLKEIEAQAPEGMFIRTHRSHLVNIAHIDSIRLKASGSGEVILKGGQHIALSKAHKQAVRACLQNAA